MSLDKRLRDLEQRARRTTTDDADVFDLPDDPKSIALAERFAECVAVLPHFPTERNAQVRAIIADPATANAANEFARHLATLRNAERQARYGDSRFGWRPM